MSTVAGVDPLATARPLSWVVVIGFLATAALRWRDDRDERARAVGTATWVLFAAFWLVLVPHFAITQRSIVEGVGSLAAVPLALIAGLTLWRGRDSLFVLSKAVGIMGLVYLPFTYLPLVPANPARKWLVEAVAGQTVWLLGLLGSHPELTTGNCGAVPRPGCTYQSTMKFAHAGVPDVTYTIIIACTGLGSIAIFVGAVLAVRADWTRKLKALAVVATTIYALNLVRNVFIAFMFGGMRMQWAPGLIGTLFGFDPARDPAYVSYYVADRLLAQFGSVIALVILTLVLVRLLPEVVVLVEDLLYLVTGTEYDVEGAILDEETDVEPAPEPAPGDD